MEVNFIRGLLYGIVIAVTIGYILGRMGKAKSAISRKDKKLDTFGDASHSVLTPAKIVRESFTAMLQWLFWFLVLLIVIAAIIFIAFQMWRV